MSLFGDSGVINQSSGFKAFFDLKIESKTK